MTADVKFQTELGRHMSWREKNITCVCVVVIRSPVDGRLFLAYPHDSGALSQSFDKLQLLDDGGSDLVSVIYFKVLLDHMKPRECKY